MKKEIIHKPRDKTIVFLLLGLFLIAGIYTTTLGYSLFNSEHLISGEAHVRVDADIRVTNIKVKEMSDNAYPTYKPEYSKERSSMFTTIKTSGESVVYEVTITNKSSKRFQLTDIIEEINSNKSITYEIIDLYINDIIEPNTEHIFTIKQTSSNGNQIGDLVIQYKFEELQPVLLADKILIDNPNVNTRTTFNTIFTANNNGNTIYKALGQDNKETYYFAGRVSNNYVKFGTDASGQSLYWRIVRINEDNSVRLIFAGTSATDTTGFISTSQAFNTSNNGTYHVGYEYANGEQHGTGTNSSVKTVIDNWYVSNLSDEGDYLSRTAIYCNDRTVASDQTWVSNPSGNMHYVANERLSGNLSSSPYYNKAVMPTFNCSNIKDRFTASITTGNGALENPIALITADEVSFAGAFYPVSNTNYYLFDNASVGNHYWWTMTPISWHSLGSGVFYVNVRAESVGAGLLGDCRVHYLHAVRPVISLKSCVEWKSGTSGTASNPYEVTISDTCASLEN